MPHYRDGTPAKNGDLVIHREMHDGGNEKILIVQSIMPRAETCNATGLLIASRQKGTEFWLPSLAPYGQSVTLRECEKLGDAPMIEPHIAASEAMVT